MDCMSNSIPQNFNLSIIISTYWLISACMSRAARNMLFFWVPVNEPLLSESQKSLLSKFQSIKITSELSIIATYWLISA